MFRAFFVARLTANIASRRPKACDPGAATRATDGWTMCRSHKGGAETVSPRNGGALSIGHRGF